MNNDSTELRALAPPASDVDHVAMLHRSIREFNDWRQIHPAEFVKLTAADLVGYDLRHVDLRRADLRQARLREANLHSANLAFTRLGDSIACDAVLTKAVLNDADLSDSYLKSARFDQAMMLHANLTRAHLKQADLTGADLRRANLTNADLSDAVLFEANLQGTNLNDASVITGGTTFIQRLFPFYRLPFVLSNTGVERTRFDRRSGDPWNVLRREYTGPRYVVMLLLFTIFLLPHVAKTLLLVGLYHTEQMTIRSAMVGTDALQKAAETSGHQATRQWARRIDGHPVLNVPAEHPISRTQLNELTEIVVAAAEIEGNMPVSHRASHLQALLQPMLDRDNQERRIWQLVIGWHEGWLSALLVILLASYNMGRVWLTLQMNILRDETSNSARTPFWNEYRLLWRLHQGLSVLFLLAGVSFVTNLINVGSYLVIVPSF